MSRDDNAATNMPRQHRAHHPGPPAYIVTWSRLGRAAGYFAGVAFFAQTVLYLLDVTGALALQAQYQVTERGLQQDLIDYYINYNDRMHSIWWNVALRDVLGPLGYLALTVLILALLHVAGTRRPREELGQLFVVLGASAAALSDLAYLSHITWWREGGFQSDTRHHLPWSRLRNRGQCGQLRAVGWPAASGLRLHLSWSDSWWTLA